MNFFLIIGTILVCTVINVISAPQFTGCGANGCLSVSQNGPGVGCGPTGCGFFGQGFIPPPLALPSNSYPRKSY